MAHRHRVKPAEQWSCDHAFATQAEAMQAGPDLADALRVALKAKGLTVFEAPPLPPSRQVEWAEIVKDCRVLVYWHPDWLPPEPLAGKYVARVDTFAR